jgi:putative lipoic acid-binding regulatory protein
MTPEIEFPVDWEFRIIAERSASDCRAGLEAVFRRFGYAVELQEGASSASGRYRTYRAGVTIPSRSVLTDLPAELSRIPGVKTVL